MNKRNLVVIATLICCIITQCFHLNQSVFAHNALEFETESRITATTKKGESKGPEVSCNAYCIMDANTGEVLFSKNADRAYAPASITKILTALIVAETCTNLDAKMLLPEAAFSELEIVSSTLTPSSRAMEQFSIRDLLYGMVLSSGNECAAALGIYVAGSREAFADLMNARAKEAGAINSHFENAHGLDAPSHKTTATDMAHIFRTAMQNPVARAVLSAKEYTIGETNYAPARQLKMGHMMVNGSFPVAGVYAGKTGYTIKAGRTLVTAVERNGKDLIVVTLGSEAPSIYPDTEMLINYAFSMLSSNQVPSKETTVDGMTLTTWQSAPHIWEARVAKSGQTGCQIEAWVSKNIVRVQVPAWTEQGGQDDLVWRDATIKDGKASFFLNLADHGYETGLYNIALHAYTADGRSFAFMVQVLVTGTALQEGVMQWNGNYYYIHGNHTVAVGLCETKDGVFYADNMGRLQRGIVPTGDSYYLFSGAQCEMIDGWNVWNGNFYYVQKSGEVAQGTMQIDGRLYQFDQSGKLQSGQLTPWALHQITRK